MYIYVGVLRPELVPIESSLRVTGANWCELEHSWISTEPQLLILLGFMCHSVGACVNVWVLVSQCGYLCHSVGTCLGPVHSGSGMDTKQETMTIRYIIFLQVSFNTLACVDWEWPSLMLCHSVAIKDVSPNVDILY